MKNNFILINFASLNARVKCSVRVFLGAFCLFSAALSGSAANAQAAGAIGAYGLSQNAGAMYNPFGAGAQESTASQTNLSGAQAGTGSQYNPGGGSIQNSVSGTGFNPVTIPSFPQPTLGGPLQPFTGVPEPGAVAAPLYVRPGEKPGQFELFQKPPPEAGEFEKFVAKTIGRSLPRFGASLILNGSKGFVTPSTAVVPPSYVLNPGDELHIGVTGTVEADLNLVIDSEGKIFIPRIGPVNIAGIRYGQLAEAIQRNFDSQYKHVNVSVVISHLHGLTVYVTGYAVSPGAYTVSSLSTMVNAVLAAGGPSSGGSFRTIELRRDGKLISSLDMYDLLISGDKSRDTVLNDQDVLDIRPAGSEIAIIGSVNDEAIYEARPGETLSDMIRFAGGLNSLADRTRLIISRLSDLDRTGSQQINLAQTATTPVEPGEIVRVLSLANIARAQERQDILATIEGEVDHPGRYYLSPGSTLADLLRISGGPTAGAFLYGAELDRVTVQRQQKLNYDRVIDEIRLVSSTESLIPKGSNSNSEERSESMSRSLGTLITQLKDQEPTGRIILPISYERPQLPTTLLLENLDHIYIPPVPHSIGVYGLVYDPGAFLYEPGKKLGDYLGEAGGVRRKVAETSAIFIVRANGSVVSRTESRDILKQSARLGDVIFVPLRAGPGLLDRLQQISQLVFQYGVGLGALVLSFKALD